MKLVIGASGFLGSHVTRLLVADGERVRVMLRKTSSTKAIDDLDVQRCYGDVFDDVALRARPWRELRRCATRPLCTRTNGSGAADTPRFARCPGRCRQVPVVPRVLLGSRRDRRCRAGNGSRGRTGTDRGALHHLRQIPEYARGPRRRGGRDGGAAAVDRTATAAAVCRRERQRFRRPPAAAGSQVRAGRTEDGRVDVAARPLQGSSGNSAGGPNRWRNRSARRLCSSSVKQRRARHECTAARSDPADRLRRP